MNKSLATPRGNVVCYPLLLVTTLTLAGCASSRIGQWSNDASQDTDRPLPQLGSEAARRREYLDVTVKDLHDSAEAYLRERGFEKAEPHLVVTPVCTYSELVMNRDIYDGDHLTWSVYRVQISDHRRLGGATAIRLEILRRFRLVLTDYDPKWPGRISYPIYEMKEKLLTKPEPYITFFDGLNLKLSEMLSSEGSDVAGEEDQP